MALYDVSKIKSFKRTIAENGVIFIRIDDNELAKT